MTILHRNFVPTLFLLILAPIALQAEPPTASPRTVTVECERIYISQVDAARVMHTDNFWQTYSKRQSLYANVARLCQAGIGQVVLLAQEPQSKARSKASVASR